jgi:hypothetical protein
LLHYANIRDVTRELGIAGLVSPPRNVWGTSIISLGGILTRSTGAGWADKFWNIAAFDASKPELRWRFGNVGRNVLRGPGYLQWDASLSKNFALPLEGHRLQFRWEVFNTTNKANWNVPAADVRSPASFGRVLSARNMREMQVALKYTF